MAYFWSKTTIQSKFVRVLLLQMLFISITTALGVYIAAKVVEKVMLGTALKQEAVHYWHWQSIDAQHPLPNTDNLRGFSVGGPHGDTVPDALRDAPLGQSRQVYAGSTPIVYVAESEGERLFLVFDEQSVTGLSFWFGVVPLSLGLIVIYISAWFVYRQSSKTLSPLMSLAHMMRSFDRNHTPLGRLDFSAWRHTGVDDEVRVLSDSLQDFTEQLTALLERERAFSRDVSHELRTPLAVLSGALEILQKKSSPTVQQQRVLLRMETTIKDMQSLIETLLLLARRDHQSRSSEHTQINALVRLLIQQIDHSHNTDQHIDWQIQDDAQLSVSVPSQAAGLVISNLLRNACLYTPQGEVQITIHATGVVIRDTGAGMDAKHVEQLMKPFERIEGQGQGYGLGLDIVRRVCERYGWRLNIDSTPGRGTEVAVTLLTATTEGPRLSPS